MVKQIKTETARNAAEFSRCVGSFLYFVCRYCFLEDRKTKQAILFKLWPGQAEATPKFLNSKKLLILKARQLGLTWLTAAYVVWRAIFHFHEYIIIISGTEDLAVEFLERVKFIFDRLPYWMKPSVAKRTTTELKFGEEITDDHGQVQTIGLNSTIKSIPSTPNAGQSKTISLLVLDEAALNHYCKEIWSAAEPTLEHADGQVIVLSNPTKTAPGWGWMRKMYANAMVGANGFERLFLDWKTVPGRGPDFLEEKRRSGLDKEDIIMQYPSSEAEALSALLGTFFGETLAKHDKPLPGRICNLIRSREAPERGEIENNAILPGILDLEDDRYGNLCIWELPYDRQPGWDKVHWKRRYAIGSDISEGLAQDYSVAYVLDRLSRRIVARMRSNKIDSDSWADMLYDLAEFYHNGSERTIVCPERTGSGQSVVRKLLKLRQPMYRVLVPGTAGKPVTQKFGWVETRQSKYDLAEDLKTYLKNSSESIPCDTLIAECGVFIRNNHGALGAETGEHDDHVIGAGCMLQADRFLGASPEQIGVEVERDQFGNEVKPLPANLPPHQAAIWRHVQELKAQLQRESEAYLEDF